LNDDARHALRRVINLAATLNDEIDALAVLLNERPRSDSDYGIIDLRFDGGLKEGKAYGSYQLNDHPPVRVKHAGLKTSNQAEYATLLKGLDAAVRLVQPEFFRIRVYGDSQLVIRQLSGEYNAADPKMREFRDRADAILKSFASRELNWVPREVMVSVFGH
jgi:hypothetical protein